MKNSRLLCLLETTGSLHYKAIKSQTASSGGRLPLPNPSPPPRGPPAEYKMFPTPKFARTFPYQVRLATSTTVTEPSFIIPPPPTHHHPLTTTHPPFTSLCKSSSTVFGSQIPPHQPPPFQRFLFESTLLLSERYYLFYRINEVKLLYEFVCDVSFLLQPRGRGKEPLLHVLMTFLILPAENTVCELALEKRLSFCDTLP